MSQLVRTVRGLHVAADRQTFAKCDCATRSRWKILTSSNSGLSPLPTSFLAKLMNINGGCDIWKELNQSAESPLKCVARKEVANLTLCSIIILNTHTHRIIAANKLCLVITVAIMECVVWSFNVSQCCNIFYSTVQQQVKVFIILNTREFPWARLTVSCIRAYKQRLSSPVIHIVKRLELLQ